MVAVLPRWRKRLICVWRMKQFNAAAAWRDSFQAAFAVLEGFFAIKFSIPPFPRRRESCFGLHIRLFFQE